MVLKIYSVLDTELEQYQGLIVLENDKHAIRWFQSHLVSVLEKNLVLDLQVLKLYNLGMYDTETGSISPCLELVKQYTNQEIKEMLG